MTDRIAVLISHLMSKSTMLIGSFIAIIANGRIALKVKLASELYGHKYGDAVSGFAALSLASQQKSTLSCACYGGDDKARLTAIVGEAQSRAM